MVMNSSMELKKIGSKSARLAGLGLFVKGASLLKCSFILGSQMAHFSASSVAVPLVGKFGGPFASFFIAAFRLLFYGSSALSAFAFVIPGLCASLYWSSNSWLIR